MSMTVRYEFESMQSLADYFDAKAADIRQYIGSGKLKRAHLNERRGEALAYESASHIVRNTTIRSKRAQE